MEGRKCTWSLFLQSKDMKDENSQGCQFMDYVLAVKHFNKEINDLPF
jgi:hypothetical protein